MTNVYHLPTARSKPINKTDGLEGKARRAERLRRALANKVVFNQDDQLRAAANTHRLLGELESEFSVKRCIVAREAGLGGNGDTDSTKRLDTYTLPNDANDKRRGRIAKKPDKYFEFAKVIANHRGEADDLILCRLFEGCSYGSDIEIIDDWENRSWTMLAEQIHQMAEAVISDVNLPDYWRRVAGIFEVRYDVRKGAFANEWTNSSLFELKEGLADNVICSDEIPPVPSTFLARRLQADPVSGALSATDGTEIPVTFRLWLEIRLALGPVNGLSRIGPLLEFRTVLDALDENNSLVTFDNPYTDGSDIIRVARRDGVEIALNNLYLSPFDDGSVQYRNSPEPEYRPSIEWSDEFSYEHSYFAWRDVSPALLREIFGDESHQYEVSERLLGEYRANLPPVRFGEGTPGAALQVELLQGALETALIEECQRLIDDFERYRFDFEARVRAAEAAAQARWRTRTKRTRPSEN
ncbi:hypothetical protein [Rhodovulum adriaticum]|uniref:Uncharacterized protein n=1 Tax=Rhodovulum adriaticum TaxID=35804 RepID=A0A4R2NFV2_RHOAD|nr:hypothetical protein [Rhodovulum adriaticum]MBK1636860.1 hypothetical protein [Rhodovulum adriaticum]TCP20269.1 hypothetical protein EV656_1213 [Rhodovulum adriaticum]